MRTTRPFLLVLAALLITSFNVSAAKEKECAPQVQTLLKTNTTYKQLARILKRDTTNLRTLLNAVTNQATYTDLLNVALRVATSLPNGRLLVTLPDGTVVVDTSRPVDPDDLAPVGNSFKHFKDKTVNENHNTRVAILHSQLHVCGVGVETKLSTTDSTKESYVAMRLGAHLNNSGTARLSVKQ